MYEPIQLCNLQQVQRTLLAKIHKRLTGFLVEEPICDESNALEKLAGCCRTSVILGKYQSLAPFLLDDLPNEPEEKATAMQIFNFMADAWDSLGDLARKTCKGYAISLVPVLNEVFAPMFIKFHPNMFGGSIAEKLGSHGRSYLRRSVAKAEIVVLSYLHALRLKRSGVATKKTEELIRAFVTVAHFVVKYLEDIILNNDAERLFIGGNVVIRSLEIVYNAIIPTGVKQQKVKETTYAGWWYPDEYFKYIDDFNDVRIADGSNLSKFPRKNLTEVEPGTLFWNPRDCTIDSPIHKATKRFLILQRIYRANPSLCAVVLLYTIAVHSFSYEKKYIRTGDISLAPCSWYEYVPDVEKYKAEILEKCATIERPVLLSLMNDETKILEFIKVK